MGGSKYNRLLGNKFIAKYKNSLAYSTTKKLTQSEQYNYLQNSIIPTQHFQKSLTKLKIPKLEDTMNRYLSALKPLLGEAEYKQMEEVSRNFEKNEAQQLDKEIRELDNQDKHGNYISEPWFDMYLRARESIVLNYNPFICFQPDPNPAQRDQAIRTTNFLISSLRFLKSYRANRLKPEIFHLNPEKSDTVLFQRLMRMIPESVSFYGAYMFNAYPLDMSQYFRLFNSTRIPKKDKDVLFTDESKRHIAVLFRGHFFCFPVLDKNNNIFAPEEIYACIKYILNSNVKPAEHPLGVLTSENRDTWAAARERLESLGNKEALNAIDSALYCISPDEFQSDDHDLLSNNFLTGDAGNRWFDKNLTLIFSKNGHAAINFEHSWGDGVAVLRFFNELYDDTTKNPFITSKTVASFDRGDINKWVKRLEFKLDDSVKASIEKAQLGFEQMRERVKLRNFELATYGRDFVKGYNLSPDSVMQAAIQVAYYKTFNRFVATYESASTCAFKHGRTETVRPLTMQTKRLAEFMAEKKSTDNHDEVYKLLQDCTKVHNKLVKEGAMGEGFDRHLFAMKYHAANRKKTALPEFYNSPAYKQINHNILSTSTLAYPTIMTCGFGPVVNDGFGIGYRILDKSLGACVTAYNQSDLNKFVESLQETYERLHRILKRDRKSVV